MAFTSYKEAVDRLRRYINDIPQLNTLDRDYESTDDELEEAIKDCLVEINLSYEPKTNWALASIIVEPEDAPSGSVPWSVVKMGALLQLLTAKGILSARNAITYSDAGGVQVSEMDKWGRYLNYFNTLAAQYERRLVQIKTRQNIQDAFGGVNSPMGFDFYYG